jgi:hypothetical protein
MQGGTCFVKRGKVDEKEIAEAMAQLSKIRDANDQPTKEEVEELIRRQKKRWGIMLASQ